MKLSREQLRQLKAGDYSPLMFPFDPKDTQLENLPGEGERVVLNAQPSRREVDRDGNVWTTDYEPLRWIEVTSIKRHRKGDWQVRFDVHDCRHTERYLRATPPVFDPHSNSTSDPMVDADRSAYTSSRYKAVDELPAVPRKYQEQLSKTAYDRDRVARLEKVAARQQDKWRFKRERQRAAMRFRPAA